MSDDDDRPTHENTLAPARNFSISVGDRVRAAAGPPPWAVRKRRIEDLEEILFALFADALERARDAEHARRALAARKVVARHLGELASLVAAHNAFYPIEANLPLDPRTGQMLLRGEPWRPMATPTFDSIFAAALAR